MAKTFEEMKDCFPEKNDECIECNLYDSCSHQPIVSSSRWEKWLVIGALALFWAAFLYLILQ